MNLKRLAFGLLGLVLLLHAAAGIWWLWAHRPTPGAANFLPENTFLLVHIPDADATRKAYAASHLKKVIESEEISSFIALAWKSATEKISAEDMTKASTAMEIGKLFDRNMTGEAFLAITQVDFQQPTNNRFIAGLKPKQGLVDMAPLVNRIKQVTGDSVKNSPSGKGNHGGVEYEWVDLEGKAKLCLAVVGPWEIVAIGEPAFFDFVDRFQAGGKTPGSLANYAPYQSVVKRMKGRQDAVAYLGFDSVKPTLLKLAESRPELQKSAPSLKKIYEQIKSVGWGGKFEDGRINETIVSLLPKASRPDLGKSYEPCAYKTLPMTSAQTYFYVAQSLDFRKYWDYVIALYSESNPDLAATMKQAPEWAKSQGLDFNKNLLDALGSEYAVVFDWSDEAMIPDLAIVFTVANPADLKPTIDCLIKNATLMLRGEAAIDDAKVGAYDLKVFHFKQAPMISPTLITSGDKFGLVLTQNGAKRMLGGKGDTTLAKQPAFKALGGDKMDGTISIAYFNFGGLIDHTYQIAKPYVGLAAMMSPEAQKLLGSAKLPDRLSFTSDLGSWLTLSRVDDEGATVNSVSNIGNLPLAIGGISVAAAATIQQNKMRSNRRPATVRTAAPQTASGEPTAESVKGELEELRAVIEAYAVAQDIPKGTIVTWAAISTYLVPDSPLQKRSGKDAFGNDYALGILGEAQADVAPETKAKFTDRDEAFWKSATPASP